jgi:uncharacterized protein (TIGR00255 family)
MRSMTGYGRGTSERSGRRVVVELRAVNHRFLDLKVRGTPLDPAAEELVTAKIREGIERGAVSIAVNVERKSESSAIRIDRAVARDVFGQLSGLAEELGTDRPSLALVVAQPGVVLPPGDEDPDLGPALAEAAAVAVAQLVAMRETEGKTLARDLGQRLAKLGELLATLEQNANAAPDDVRRRLGERLERLLGDKELAIDPHRLAQEVAILADKSDVTEELVRAKSHIEQLIGLLADRGPVGRRIDFLIQELGRELNTMGAKSSLLPAVRGVIAAKAELEKIREQVQNVE